MCQHLPGSLGTVQGLLQSLGEAEEHENHGIINVCKALEGAPHKGVIREGFLGEGAPELSPEVGVVPVVRKHGLWDALSGSLLNLDFKARSTES